MTQVTSVKDLRDHITREGLYDAYAKLGELPITAAVKHIRKCNDVGRLQELIVTLVNCQIDDVVENADLHKFKNRTMDAAQDRANELMSSDEEPDDTGKDLSFTTRTELWIYTVRGLMANMFMQTATEPTLAERRIMNGRAVPTLPDLAEAAHRCGHVVKIGFIEDK